MRSRSAAAMALGSCDTGEASWYLVEGMMDFDSRGGGWDSRLLPTLTIKLYEWGSRIAAGLLLVVK